MEDGRPRPRVPHFSRVLCARSGGTGPRYSRQLPSPSPPAVIAPNPRSPPASGAVMISIFANAMDRHVDGHFMKDPSGRLVFLPFGLKKQAYFVDSKSDEEK